jgi:hypothetical protein
VNRSQDKDALSNFGARRTTFSQEVHDISNGMKLKNKIQGDRDKVDKIKAVKRGEVVVEDEEPNSPEKERGSELCAAAKPLVPAEVEEVQLQRGDSKKSNVKKSKGEKTTKTANAGENHPSASGASDGKHFNKSKKSKQPSQQSSNDSSGGVNLTLQAIQQSKQQKKAPAKQKKEKVDHRTYNAQPNADVTDSQIKKSDSNGPSQHDKAKVDKKSQVKHKSDANSKPDPKNKKDKSSKEKPTNKVKAPSNASPSIPPNVPQTTNDLNYGAGRPIVVVHIAEKPSIAQVGA